MSSELLHKQLSNNIIITAIQENATHFLKKAKKIKHSRPVPLLPSSYSGAF